MVTNGDNEYGAGFMERVVHEASTATTTRSPAVDVVAFDFYSRFLRPTMPACDRFEAGGHFPCKRNRLRWCHSDLGAAALRWPRFTREGRRFGDANHFRCRQP